MHCCAICENRKANFSVTLRARRSLVMRDRGECITKLSRSRGSSPVLAYETRNHAKRCCADDEQSTAALSRQPAPGNKPMRTQNPPAVARRSSILADTKLPKEFPPRSHSRPQTGQGWFHSPSTDPRTAKRPLKAEDQEERWQRVRLPHRALRAAAVARRLREAREKSLATQPRRVVKSECREDGNSARRFPGRKPDRERQLSQWQQVGSQDARKTESLHSPQPRLSRALDPA